MFKNKNQKGRGFAFDEEETAKVKLVKKILSKSYGFELNDDDEMEIENRKKIEEQAEM